MKRMFKAVTVVVLIVVLAVCCVACKQNHNGQPEELNATTTFPLPTEYFEKPSYPWDEVGAKQPAEYTWGEFEALSGGHQIGFQNSFETFEDFEKWMAHAKGEDQSETLPWEVEGAKQPTDYTWEEFEALSGAQQIAFQNSFGSFEAFDQWLIANQPQ